MEVAGGPRASGPALQQVRPGGPEMEQSRSSPLADLFPLHVTEGTATATTEGDLLRVSTGVVERRWRWTGAGLATVGFRELGSGREWADLPAAPPADWSFPGWEDAAPEARGGPTDAAARLIALEAGPDDDGGFTSRHLRVTAEVHHPGTALTVKLAIWAYPGAPGLRTQLWVKGRPRAGAHPEEARVDHLPVLARGKRTWAIGYYNDTQHRNTPETPVLRREAADPDGSAWASILCVEDGRGGLAMVKESHKCVNQAGVATGRFVLDATGLANTGSGLSPADLDEGVYRWCWASWTLVHGAGDIARQSALKRFDRLRFPTRAERDMWTVACTWGESANPRDGRDRASQAEVLAEMRAAHEMAIDMLLIDDGWQVGPESRGWAPDGGDGWRPHPVTHPGGWAAVREGSRALGVRLGLWGVAQAISVDEMVWNWRQLGMEQFKLDFAGLRDHAALEGLIQKVRAFMQYSGQRCIISWDTTENAPRYGYFWAREYGNVHFMNRKPRFPAGVVYVPWLALRDFWQLAHYQNLNKWQLTIHNPEVVDRDLSDAHLHSPEYCVATALMGTPLFMALPRHYSTRARERIAGLLAVYKQHRRRIWDAGVFPLGDEPSNASWSGFQACTGDGEGYLTVFRERLNNDTRREMALAGVAAGTRLSVTDLWRNQEWGAVAGAGGAVPLEIGTPGDFLFLRYGQADRAHP